jgi:hypothetical protein
LKALTLGLKQEHPNEKNKFSVKKDAMALAEEKNKMERKYM